MSDGPRTAIVVGRFYADLARAARRRRAGRARRAPERRPPTCTTSPAPSSCRWPPSSAPRAGATTAVICLGAVIRGETDHYDYVCAEAARGIQDVQLRTGIPTAFGVLTVDTMDQALARSGGDTRDSGRHAADAVLRAASPSASASRPADRRRRRIPVWDANRPHSFSSASRTSSEPSCCIWMLTRAGGAAPGRGFWFGPDRDDDPRPPQDDPIAPGGAALPLPHAQASDVRLRGPGRLADARPLPARRPEHAPEPARTPDRT